jgi:hypothetical protein
MDGNTKGYGCPCRRHEDIQEKKKYTDSFLTSAEGGKKNLFPLQEFEPRTLSSSRHTDYAISATHKVIHKWRTGFILLQQST